MKQASTEDNFIAKKNMWITEMMGRGIIKIAPSRNEKTWFVLKSGSRSPIYVNMRNLQSHISLLIMTIELMAEKAKSSGIKFDRITAVPFGALSPGIGLGIKMGIPIVIPREGEKSHGMGGKFVGEFSQGDNALIVEDTTTTAGSIIKVAEKLRRAGMNVGTAMVIVDREQGARENLARENIGLLNVCTLKEMCSFALKGSPMRSIIYEYLANSRS